MRRHGPPKLIARGYRYESYTVAISGTGLLVLPPLLMLLFRGKYPRWWFDFNRELLRFTAPLIKWLLAIPHYIVLAFLYLGVLIAVVIAWFAILFTGRYPRGLYDYVVGVGRWHLRVVAYAFALVTDEYPPFRLAP